ncbi:MAG: hypothetical protein Q4D38_08035 [Planctomycetia bacterium]|nr:hypothetical protein [Planctomycetia bacterium]
MNVFESKFWTEMAWVWLEQNGSSNTRIQGNFRKQIATPTDAPSITSVWFVENFMIDPLCTYNFDLHALPLTVCNTQIIKKFHAIGAIYIRNCSKNIPLILENKTLLTHAPLPADGVICMMNPAADWEISGDSRALGLVNHYSSPVHVDIAILGVEPETEE